MTDKINDFIDAMREHGIGPAQPERIVADDKRHRYQVDGDRPKTLNGEYCLRVDVDGFAVGWFKSYKTMPDAVSWHSKSKKKRVSAEERKAWADRMAIEAARREADDAALRERARQECARLWSEAEDGDGTHSYVVRKGAVGVTHRVWMDFDAFESVLLVPAMRDGEMVGLQKIYPDGRKLFVVGSDLNGSACWIGPEDSDTVAIVEGWATGAAVVQATGWRVAVAFNAGNLAKVAAGLKGSDRRILICADEDKWTPSQKWRASMPDVLPDREAAEWDTWRANGWLVNTGRDKAMEAAGVLGGCQVLYPVEGGDWNDVMVRDGVEAVRDRLTGLVEMASAPEEYTGWVPEEEVVGVTAQDVMPPMDLLAELVGPLGYDKEVYFFLPKTKGQIIELTATALGSANNLYQLANQFDYSRVIGEQADTAAKLAQTIGPMLIDMCHKKGIYEPEKVYGAGAWKVGGAVWLNTGRQVYNCATGEALAHADAGIDGVFVKEARAYDLNCLPLLTGEANKLVQICQALKWKRPISGTLLAGWLVIAAVGGALRWRPHVFITGPKGAGKSTVVESIVEVVLRCALRQDGGSTEAGLRRQVGDSCRPFIMDEFEGELLRDKENVQKIFTWTRKASSGGMIVNANGTYRARSCVCFAAINPMIIQGADADRITVLELMVNKDRDAESQYSALMDLIHETMTADFADRLVRRTVDNIDALLRNCEVFSKHASRILGSKRAGDQIGPMLAGAYMLHAKGEVTDERAEEYCQQQDWSWVDEQQDGTDSERLVRRIMNSMIEYSSMDKTVRMPVSEMIMRVYVQDNGWHDAAKALTRVGMAVKDGWLCVANSDDGLSGLLKDTPWQVYRPSLSRMEGCITDGKTMRFGNGAARRYMKIPLAGIVDGIAGDVELDFEGDT